MRIFKRAVRTPGFYNFNGVNLNKWRNAQIAVAAGTRNATLLCLGDSTTAGQGSMGNGISSNAKSNSYPTKLAALLANASGSSFTGDNNVGAAGGNPPAFDSRITRSGAWTGSVSTLGGVFMKSPASASAMHFTPANNIDTVTVYFAFAPGNGTFTVGVDGGAALATQATAAANNQGSVTVNPTLGAHTIDIVWSSGGSIFINGILAFASGTKEISILNAGSCTALILPFTVATQTWDALNRLGSIAPDLSILMFGINDWDAPTPINTFLTSLPTVINKAKLSGDAILMSGIPTNPATQAALVTQAAFSLRMKQFAYESNIPFIDVFNLMYGNHSDANSAGWKYDTFHCNNAGYTKIAGWVNQALAGGFVSN